jgi:hypothetical protein
MNKQCVVTPYTHTEKSVDLCCVGCDKSGLGSKDHNPYNNSCNDCAALCCPVAVVLDILCFIPMCLGYYEVKEI